MRCTFRIIGAPLLLSLGLLASCSSGDADEQRLLSHLTAVEKKQFLDDAAYRKEVTPLMIAAEACLNDYPRRNPVREAEKEARYDNPLFFYNYYSGVVEGRGGTGINCGPGIGGLGPGWQELKYYQAMGDGSASTQYIDECNTVALAYGTRYNKKLAALRPDALKAICEASQP